MPSRTFVTEERPWSCPDPAEQEGRKKAAAKAQAQVKAQGKAKSGGEAAAALLDGAILVALAPALLVAAGAVGVKLACSIRRWAYDLMTRDLAPKAAMPGRRGPGVLGLIVGPVRRLLGCGRRRWLALALTIATLG